jgi:hypothetical protein
MEDTASTPATPQAPSLSSQIQDYINSLPSILQAQQQYGPAFEQQNLATQKTFAPQYKQLQDSLYPELAGLRDQLFSQATVGAQNGGLPEYMRNQYLDQFRAEVGANNGSGVGADYISRKMLNQAEAYKQYNQNMGMSLIGAQPLYQAGQAGQSFNANAGYNAGSALNYGASTYGNYVGSYANMYGANAGLTKGMNDFYGGLINKGIGAAASFAGGMAPA